MRKLILGAGAALAVAAGQAAGQGFPTQTPAPVVPIGQAGPAPAAAATPVPVNGAPVSILGSSHFELRHGKIIREWRIYDEIAVIAQILRHATERDQ